MNKIESLLKWCENQLSEYPNISIQNFTTSWKNGLAFNALIHKFKPDLIDYHGLDPSHIYYNNYKAFKIAETQFGIPSLLDPRDMENSASPERLSIITYVSQFYNCLREMKPEGGYKVNKFKNTNNGNLDFENISSRASISRLSNQTCSICSGKVFLLERYVADDKLYHRDCYRKYQIKNIGTESEIIGDYLNIYGEINPKLNSNIYVHPLKNFNSDDKIVEIETSSPVNLSENSESETEEFEDLSESLSSYNNSDDLSNYNSDENNSINNYNANLFVDKIDDQFKYDIYKEEANQHTESLDNMNSVRKEIELKLVETDINNDPEKNFENKKIIINKINFLNEPDQNSNTIENLKDIDKTFKKNISVSCETPDVYKDSMFVDFKIINNQKESEESDDKNEEFNAVNIHSPGIHLTLQSKIKEFNKSKHEIKPVRLVSQENLVITINESKEIKPVKQRLYIKKRDKKLPYSTFFEVSNNKCAQMQSQNLEQNTCTKPECTPIEMRTKFQENLREISNDTKELVNTHTETANSKKLIKISDNADIEYESDVSSIEEEEYDFIKPQITRNSIWRKPIISSAETKKYKSTCVPIEGKFRDYAEFKERLEELNSKQSDIEIKARNIQQKLWIENSNTLSYESLLVKWLDLVEEKDKLFYEENALYSWIKDLKLQEMKSKLEAQIRLLSSTNSNDPINKEKEKELVAKLIETVNKRAELVDAMHEENIRRLEVIKNRHEAEDKFISSQDKCSINHQSKHEKTHKSFWSRKTSN